MTIVEFASFLATHFKEEPSKITLWWHTKNPIIGGVTPAELYILRPEKAMIVFESLANGEEP